MSKLIIYRLLLVIFIIAGGYSAIFAEEPLPLTSEEAASESDTAYYFWFKTTLEEIFSVL